MSRGDRRNRSRTATDLAIGDAVMAMVVNSASHGGYRESIVLSADSVVRTPAGATLIEAATLPMNGLTARQSLDQLALRPGRHWLLRARRGATADMLCNSPRRTGCMLLPMHQAPIGNSFVRWAPISSSRA